MSAANVADIAPGQPGLAPAQAEQTDRRKYPRRSCAPDAFGFLFTDLEDDPLHVRLCDVSKGGIAVEIGRPIPAERVVLIDLPARPGALACGAMARVVRCHQLPGGEYLIGCALFRELNDAEYANVI
jgi:hypothetical protein